MVNLVFNYQIAREARVGFSLVSCDRLIMEPGSSIGHFTVVKSIDLVLAESAKIRNFNWIFGIGPNDPVTSLTAALSCWSVATLRSRVAI